MSFTELMGSSRGPGVIGMLFAILVLVGFGLLFTLVFDESGGGKSLAAVIRDNRVRIASDRSALEIGEARLAKAGEYREAEAKLSEIGSKIGFLRTRIAEEETEAVTVRERIAVSKERFEDYKNEYRAFVRTEAEGSKLDSLETGDGKTFANVSIRKVTAVGIDIRHRDGLTRIEYEELPEEMQDYYQFDADQKAAEISREAKMKNRHYKAVAVAETKRSEVMAVEREEAELQAEADRQSLIVEKRARITTLQSEITQLESEVSSADSAAASARASGKMHLSRSGPLRNRIASKQAVITRIENEIAKMQASP